ncbi:hypothetical protein OG936_40075 (plasmid) [Streptomyces sp. NBC_00846]|uniref:hypothetical protein n=1 Tax=Streptomyces sp. NBC_00846 TaxID=2975849 RepID=UPI00387060C4|nr:hypothetical protein OG936_40075 [Streptomyces sp. NBC_00846]
MSQLPHQPQVSDRDSADRRPKPQYQGLFLEPNVTVEPFEDDQDLMEDQRRSITA